MSDTALASATDPRLLRALNSVCPYYTMFPLDFPLARLAGASTGDWVLDPFCGRGSTNLRPDCWGFRRLVLMLTRWLPP